MNTPITAFDIAKRVAHLMGGNGLTTDQSIQVIAHEVANWREGREIYFEKGQLMARNTGSGTFRGTHPFNRQGADSVARERGFQQLEQLVKFLLWLEQLKLPKA